MFYNHNILFNSAVYCIFFLLLDYKYNLLLLAYTDICRSCSLSIQGAELYVKRDIAQYNVGIMEFWGEIQTSLAEGKFCLNCCFIVS